MTDTYNETNRTNTVQLQSPRFEDSKPLMIAGLRQGYTPEIMNNIPAQWQRFAPYIGRVPGQIGQSAYGLVFQMSSGFDYLSGVEVPDCAGLPGEFSCVTIPAQRYAVFQHQGHVSTLGETCDAIGNQWFPQSGYKPAEKAADAPNFFERYTEAFNPITGMGGIEVWIPIKS